MIFFLPRLVNFGFGKFSSAWDCNQYGVKNAVMKISNVTPYKITAVFSVLVLSYHSYTILMLATMPHRGINTFELIFKRFSNDIFTNKSTTKQVELPP